VAAGAISSLQSEGETEETLADAGRGKRKLLYVTPERFDNAEFMAALARLRVSLLVVDEAHCISEWGHSFRPAYLTLGAAARRLGRPTLLALTATAAPLVRQEIVERLGMRRPDVVVHGVDRPNLFFEVRRVDHEREERAVLEALLQGAPAAYPGDLATRLGDAMAGSGIVYTATTKAAEETAAWLTEWGVAADSYHGQRAKADRARVQDAFMDGALRVIAATNAFGLGIDKPDIRFVIHRDIPANLEAYYQEAGRAGRDGELARCALIYRPADLGRAAFLAGSSRLTREDAEKGRRGLLARRRQSWAELEASTGLSRADLAALIGILKQDGLVHEEPGWITLRAEDFDPATVASHDEEYRRAYERSRWEMMRGYAETPACRRRYILNYFGQEYEGSRCDLCDNDVLRVPGEEVEDPSGPFAVGDRVRHQAFGAGAVQRVAGDTITVLFDTVGYKTLAAGLVAAQGLLRPAPADEGAGA
jgi:ATP-dependent DNA helicase RecQ